MNLKYRTLFRIFFTYRFVFIVCTFWLVTNIVFLYKLKFSNTNSSYEEGLAGLNRNESELLENLSKKLKRLEKMHLFKKGYKQSREYHKAAFTRNDIKQKNEIPRLKNRKMDNEKLVPKSVHMNNFSKAKEDLINKGNIRKYNMKLLEDVIEIDYPGKHGRGVTIDVNKLTASQKEEFDLGWKRNQFNQYASDMIPLNRDLGEVRDPGCDQVTYPDVLPVTSVIICFHNEAWTALLRTVHSVLRHTPLELLSSIILVDDASTFQYLQRPLEDYMSQLPKVSIIRCKKREGLIRARLIGLEAAQSEVVTFLDSHCECATDWLRPMLARIAESPRSVVVPAIDVISDYTFQYYNNVGDDIHIGAFSWNLNFKWMNIPQRIREARKSNLDPIMTPTIAGGLFSVRKEFFQSLGTYDPGFDTWGSENLELSFKTWMCGGRLETIPCSHAGHIFRKVTPYKWPKGFGVLRKNTFRLAEVWLDDYKDIYYSRIGRKSENYGDVSNRQKLREKLKCNSFEWYLQNILPEMLWIKTTILDGLVMNVGSENCLTVLDNKIVQMTNCNKFDTNQHMYYTSNFELRTDVDCLDAESDVWAKVCHGLKGNQVWTLRPDKTIYHNVSNNCLEQVGNDVLLNPCSIQPQQMWNVFKSTQSGS